MRTLLLFLSIFTCLFASAQNRQIFNQGWKFALHEQKGAQLPEFDDSDWQEVLIPHDASVGGKFDKENSTGGNGWLPFQQGWYRKTFNISAADNGKKVFIDFEGIYRDSEVWINGVFLGNNLNGYLGFEYDLTSHLNFGGENTIAVLYDNRVKNTSRWYTGEGIYRDVYLRKVGEVHSQKDGVSITTPFITADLAKVFVETEVINESGKAGEITMITDLISPNGEVVASRKSVIFLELITDHTFHQEFKIENPALWDTQNPNLYYAKSILSFDGVVQEVISTRFGIRDIELTPEKGLLLNGKKVFAQGGDIHHDLGALGAVALKEGYRYRLQNLKDMGCNSIRLSHNPHAPVLLDLCDEMGILVIAETYDKWTSQYYGWERDFRDMWKTDLERFIKRDRNHSSIYIWSVGNEVDKQRKHYDKNFESWREADKQGADYLKMLVEETHKLDPTRKVTAALFPARKDMSMEWNHWNDHDEFMKTLPPPMAFNMDVVSWNYTGNFFDSDYQKYPQMMFIASETSTNLEFGTRKISMLEFDKEHVIGHYYWTALSYLGESPWPAKTWQRAFFGNDELKTPIGYIYESLYKEEPVLKIMVKEPDTAIYNKWDKHFTNKRWSWYPMHDHWNFSTNQQLEIQAFTNCDEVELTLNGKSLGSQKLEKGEEPVLYWDATFEKGHLVAIGKRDGNVVTSDTLSTAGDISTINLSANKLTMQANGSDLIYVQVSLVDQNGVVVPENQLVTFEVKGPAVIAAVSNADDFSDEPWVANSRITIDGKCLVVLRSTNEAAKITLNATTKGLKTTSLNITSK